MASIKPMAILNTVSQSKFLEKNFYKSARENPAKFAGQMALLSALTKDAVNCYYYTTQSYNNKKIPEDKRGFVASMDLMNGILNVALQFTIGKWIERKTPKWFDGIMGSKLHENRTTEIAKKLSDTIKLKNKDVSISAEQIAEHLRTDKILGAGRGKMKWLSVGFSAVTMLVGTQIICKRVFTPVIATPLAGWFKNKFLNKNAKTPAQKDDKAKTGNKDKQEVTNTMVEQEVYKTLGKTPKDSKSVFNKIASK